MTGVKGGGRSGLSILEIPVAMTVLTFGLLFLFGVFPGSFSGVSRGKNILFGTQVAEKYLEDIRNGTFDSVQTVAPTTVSSMSTLNGAASNTAYVVTVTVTPYLASCTAPFAPGVIPCPPDTTAKLQAALRKDVDVLIYEQNNPWRLYRYVTRIAK